MGAKHLYHLSQMAPDEQTAAGYRIRSSKKKFPILTGMSLYKLVLKERGIREPHWHANADELGYCLQGKVLVTLYHTGDKKATFLVAEGEAFFIPSGAIHAIENISKEAHLILQFSHEEPEDFNLSTTFGIFSHSVLGNTWGVKSNHFASLGSPPKEPLFIVSAKTKSPIPENARSDFLFNLQGSAPIVTNIGGSARMARQSVWPILTRQALYSLEITNEGMREPHWHPETAELGYVHKGRGRMSIQSPDGKVDTYIMEEGDIYFIPKAYPHHIENMDENTLHLLIFFDQPMPADIGFSGSVKSYPNELLGIVTGMEQKVFEGLPKYPKDLFIVQRVNPRDE